MVRQRKPSGPIFIVDADETDRMTLARVLGRAGYETRDLSTVQEALDLARAERPRMVILEVSLPGMCGYEGCRALREMFGNTLPILFISGERTQSSDKVAGFLVGGDDYFEKPLALDEFLARVRRHMERSSAHSAAAFALTRRETEVLSLLAEGLSQAEIARRLFVSHKTAGTHTERIFKKLGVHSRAEAIAFAFREDLVEFDAGRRSRSGALYH